MSGHVHTPAPGTVVDRIGIPCPAARWWSYPLAAVCRCGVRLSCADGSAQWAERVS